MVGITLYIIHDVQFVSRKIILRHTNAWVFSLLHENQDL